MIVRGILLCLAVFLSSLLGSETVVEGYEGRSSAILTLSKAQAKTAMSIPSRGCPADVHRTVACDHHIGLVALSRNISPPSWTREANGGSEAPRKTFEPSILEGPPRS